MVSCSSFLFWIQDEITADSHPEWGNQINSRGMPSSGECHMRTQANIWVNCLIPWVLHTRVRKRGGEEEERREVVWIVLHVWARTGSSNHKVGTQTPGKETDSMDSAVAEIVKLHTENVGDLLTDTQPEPHLSYRSRHFLYFLQQVKSSTALTENETIIPSRDRMWHRRYVFK